MMGGSALAGCSGSSVSSSHALRARAAAKPPVCLPQAKAVISRFVGTGAQEISQAPSIGNNAEPQCTFRVRGTDGRRLVVVANVDSSPQPYFRLERTAVEQTQQFSTKRLIAAPQSVKGIGLDADWYPNVQQLQTTDGRVLMTLTVTWQGVPQARRRALAVAVARPYLRPK